jgi:glycosyltransferase involved in cell wall biosynthesis
VTQTIPWCVGVVVPAHNEQLSIVRCLQSIRRAHETLGYAAALWIVVVADCCTDETVNLARRALQDDGEVIECAVRSAGAARTLGVEAVLRQFSNIPVQRVWLANTDADSHVPIDWLACHLEFATEGDTGVAGIVELEIADDQARAVEEAFRATYHFSVDGSHSHVHGANLGVRADAYLAVGGWGALALAEDHCLWNRLKTAGWQLRSTIRSRVTTSARLHGRAAGGFADTLRLCVASGTI